ncbi:hypothetical protein BRAS3809_6880002 [Bradyrhizobium sp. STM 3809]|nr:hypothetical protein BRAS3809_6880002 [Bradyrhizobium sp. STM 3809]
MTATEVRDGQSRERGDGSTAN